MLSSSSELYVKSLTEKKKEWQSDAACKEALPEVFFSDDEKLIAQAKLICRGCEVRAECLEYAIATRPANGVWGGMSERQLSRIQRLIKSGRNEEASVKKTVEEILHK